MDPQATLVTGSAPPQRLAQYELQRRVGSGAMGVVHEARDVDLDRTVAIKLLHGGGDSDEAAEQAERFTREARAAASLVHPNVAVIYQVGRHEGATFIAMEWLDGGDLSARVRREGPLPWRDAVRACADAAAGLAAAHAIGLVHRDVKPSNLMQTSAGTVKVVDFGLVRFAGTASDLTQTGALLGTPAYLSPEQCRGDEALAAADIYSLGGTLYFLLTGRAPFTAPHLAGVLHKHLNEPVPDPAAVVPGLPGGLWPILQRAMAKSPAARYAGAAEMQRDLEALLGEPPAQSPALPAAASPPPRGHVPLEPSSFIGRESDAASLAHALASSRLVTLTGPGGTGKTRLALHLAHAAAAARRPVWFAELAALAHGDEVAPALAALMALREGAGETAADVLAKALREAPALLVLDNCEHVLGSAAKLAARLLAEAPELRIVATSRERLGIAGEAVLPVSPLALAEAGADPRQLLRSEAVRLFADRGASARPGFAVDASNAEAVAAICRQLDGMPLAIELAAARLKVLSLAQITSRLNDLFKLLAGGAKSLEPRQQTLRALIDWSHQLLDDDERLAFARASVFAGEFDIEAAEAVLGGDGVLDTVASLADKSLLVARERGDRVCYRLLQTIRHYAADKLDAAGLTAATQRRHAEFYRDAMRAAFARLRGPERSSALAAFARARDDAHAALDTAVANRWFDVATPLIVALANYWNDQGQLADGQARIGRFLACAPPEDAALTALYRPAGLLALYLGNRELAHSRFARGLELARAAGDEAMQARFLSLLGEHAIRTGASDEALSWYEQALSLSRRVGQRAIEVKALNDIGEIHSERGDAERARRFYEEATVILRAMGDETGAAVVGMNVAGLHFGQGQHAQASGLYQASLDTFERLGDEWNASYARAGLGRCAAAAGSTATARQLYRQALEVLRRLGDREYEAEVSGWLAQLPGGEGGPPGRPRGTLPARGAAAGGKT
jgi:non-specific serine/threonine protein kinase